MSATPDLAIELRRLQHALEAISDELDVIEGRAHTSLRVFAERLQPRAPRTIEGFVQNFAFAMNHGEAHSRIGHD